jgi:hypothetical protein
VQLDTGNPAANDHTTFFQVLPALRIYVRTPFYNLMNNEDLFAQFRIRRAGLAPRRCAPPASLGACSRMRTYFCANPKEGG